MTDDIFGNMEHEDMVLVYHALRVNMMVGALNAEKADRINEMMAEIMQRTGGKGILREPMADTVV